jgi:hypothetical protein
VHRLLLALAALVLLAGPAAAIPGGGASPNTPGTHGSVSPRKLTAGTTIHFTVSGFPAGEVVYVKIDDGGFCSQKGVHGACVVHQQRLSGSGSAAGSFVLPGDLKPGAHWLRFLASVEMTDAQGNYLGTKGYTTRAGTDFTVVAGSGSSGSSGTSGSSGAGSGDGTSTDGGSDVAVVAAGKVLTVKTSGKASTRRPSASASAEPTSGPSTGSSIAPTTQPTSPPTTETTQVGAAPVAAATDERFPFVGSAGLALLLGAAGLLALRTRRHRRA